MSQYLSLIHILAEIQWQISKHLCQRQITLQKSLITLIAPCCRFRSVSRVIIADVGAFRSDSRVIAGRVGVLEITTERLLAMSAF